MAGRSPKARRAARLERRDRFGGTPGNEIAYLPRVVRSLRVDWRAARREAVPGTGFRGMLVAAALGGGAALAFSLPPAISAWHGGH